jgi:hypothetical protein
MEHGEDFDDKTSLFQFASGGPGVPRAWLARYSSSCTAISGIRAAC